MYPIIHSGAPLPQQAGAPSIGNLASNQRSGSKEMLTIPDDELRRWLAEDVPYGDLTTHALGFGNRPGRIRFEARQAMKVTMEAVE